MEKKNTNNNWTAALLLGLALGMGACSSEKETIVEGPVSIADLRNTDCKGSEAKEMEADGDAWTRATEATRTRLDLTLNGDGTVDGLFTDLVFTCDFGKVTVEAALSNEIPVPTLALVVYPQGNAANCICLTDCSFKLKNLIGGDYRLQVFLGNTDGKFAPDSPWYEGNITLQRGKAVSIGLE